ncbi:MAG: (d)CMP kinase [Deltaproteobacteria bacterium]|nr:(d)CMP kinase [Deltaproteobacteria bacterium]
MIHENKLIITVDGPAAAGKSTVSKVLSQRISYIYLDTGALYRAFAYKASGYGILPDDERNLSELCEKMRVSLMRIDGDMSILVNGEDVTQKIRTEQIGFLASKISAVPAVRKALLSLQREAGEKGGIIAEGRDMGTVVFPYADLKFFLDADVRERVQRRYLEMLEKGDNADFEEVRMSLIQRDQQDMSREISPLRQTDDSIFIDTTTLSVEEVVETMAGIIEKAIKNNE